MCSPIEWKQAAAVSGLHERTIFSVDWSNQGNFLVTGASDDAIRIFHERGTANNFELVHTQIQAHSSDVNCVRWSPSMSAKFMLLASAGDDSLLRIWKFTPSG